MISGKKNASAAVAGIIWMAKISQIVYLIILNLLVTYLFSCWASRLIDRLCLLLWPVWLPFWPVITLAFLTSFWQSMIVCLEGGPEISPYFSLSVLLVVVWEFLICWSLVVVDLVSWEV